MSVATGTAALHVCLVGPGHRARRRGDRAQLHLHRHQFLGGAGRRDPPLRRREPGRPLHQHRLGRKTGHAAAPRPSFPCISTATCATWTRSTAFAKKHNLYRDRGQCRGLRRLLQGAEDGHHRPHGGVQLLPEQDLHHRRRRGHGHHRRRRPGLGSPQLPRPRLRRQGAAEPAGAGAEAPLHPQSRGLELPHDRDAVGHRPGRAGPHGQLEHAAAAAQRPHPVGRPGPVAAGQVHADRHAGAAKRLVRAAPFRWTSKT